MPHEYTKQQLDSFGITELKKIASAYKIPGYTTYNSTSKQELANKIYQKFLDIEPTTFPEDLMRTPPPKPVRPVVPPPKPESPLQRPVIPVVPPPKPEPPLQRPVIPVILSKPDLMGPPPPRPIVRHPSPPSPPSPSSSISSINSILPKRPIKPGKIYFDFKDDIMPTINVELEKLPSFQNEDEEDTSVNNPNDITPEILLKLIKSDDFCIKIATSLKDIYKVKKEKYIKLEEKIKESIRIDKYEKNKMMGVVSSSDLDKMFPMIVTNTAFLIKLETLKDLSDKKYKEFSRLDKDVIKVIRKKFNLAIKDPEDGIISISGESRKLIRNQLCKQLFILSKGYRPFMDAFLNMVFTGPAGVGKTKLAKTYGFVFQNSGILLQGELIVLSPKDLVGEYVGATAIKTAGTLMKGLESVIFIDEAYQIMPCENGTIIEGKTFGPEAITEIVNFLDKNIGMSIMIVAGYEREMNGCFFAANQGLRRRFPINIQIPKYSNTDLLNIFLNESVKRIGSNIFDEEIARYIYTIIVKLDEHDNTIFGNQAGDMMNLSSMFLNSYFGSYAYNWGTYKDDLYIVNETFNLFLRNKGYIMTIK